jgi:hypothetical protein
MDRGRRPVPTEGVSGERNSMKNSLRVVLGLFLVALSFVPVALPTTAFAQNEDDKSVKQDVKDAGHSTKEATKKTGRKVKKGTKEVISKSATKTADTADKVADKTKP